MPNNDDKRSLGYWVDFYYNLYSKEGHDSFSAGKMALLHMLNSITSLEKQVTELFIKFIGDKHES